MAKELGLSNAGSIIAIIVLLFCPFILMVLFVSMSNIRGYLKILNPTVTEQRNNIIPFPIIIFSYILFFVLLIWMLHETGDVLAQYIILLGSGALYGLYRLIKKKSFL